MVCGIVTVVIAIPIISTNLVPNTVDNYESMNAMLNIIPLLIIVGVIMAVVGTFLYTRKQ